MQELSTCLKKSDDEKLHKLINPGSFGKGKIILAEEKMIANRMRFASRRGFALDVDQLKNHDKDCVRWTANMVEWSFM